MSHLSPPAPINWKVDYERRQHGRFQRAIAHIKTHKQQPDLIKPHFHSLLTLLDHADKRPSLLPMSADLIMNLRPLPKLWGFWDDWLRVCRWGADLLAQLGREREQAWLLADIIEILFELGRYDDGLAMTKTLFSIAETAGAIRPLLRGGHTAVTRLLLIGRQQDGFDLYHRQFRILVDLSSTMAKEDRLYAKTLLILQETHVMRVQGRQHEAIPKIETILTQLADWPDAPLDLWRDVYHHQGGVFLANCRYVESVASVKKAITYAVQMDDEFYEAALYEDLSQPLWNLGAFDKVEAAARRTIFLSEKLNANWSLSQSLGSLSEVFLMRKQLSEASIWIERRIELTKRMGEDKGIYAAYATRGIVHLLSGQTESALYNLQLCEAGFRELRVLRWLSMTEANLSWCYADMGDHQQALFYARQAVAHSREMRADTQEIIALRCLSRFQSGKEKLKSLNRSLQLSQNHNQPFNQAAILLLLGATIENKKDQAAFWHKATILLNDMGAEAWLEGHSPDNPPQLPLIG